MSGFKSTEREGEPPVLKGCSPGPAVSSALFPITETPHRSPALGDTWWGCRNEALFPRGPSLHA